MTDEVKKTIEQYRQKTERPNRTDVLTFRVTPEERELLLDVYGSIAGIRDFALASTDTTPHELDLKSRLDQGKADQDADKD